MSELRVLLQRSLPLLCLAYMADDWRKGQRLRRGDLATRSGSYHTDIPVDESVAYIERLLQDYLVYAGLEAFSGTIAEIGPGDNFGLALLLLHQGAEEVHALDRYRSERDPVQQRRIYEALSARHGLAPLFDGPPAEDTIRGLKYHAGEPAETYFAAAAARGQRYDVILSRAVLEHLFDVEKALDDMVSALAPGGWLVHRIDLRDHGLLSPRPPLAFLTLPDSIYTRMTRNSGRPNRVMFGDYRRWLERSGLRDNWLLVTRLVGEPDDLNPPVPLEEIPEDRLAGAIEQVQAIRPKLCQRFRAHSDADLAVCGCVLVGRKE